MHHHMKHYVQSQQTQDHELDVAPLVVAQAPQDPAIGGGRGRKDDLERCRNPAQRTEQQEQRGIEPEVDD